MLRKIERYEVEEEIGHGGMATVYRARDTKLDRLVALKIMHPHLRGAKEARARFRREAQSVARLAHPRILEIYDYSGEGSEESYIASKLLTGPTLRRWAEEHAPIPAEIAAAIGIELCAALAAAHEKKIIHRDVKPENILLHENRELVLTDFGIADMVDSQSMTATGQILGSPGHMAPEQIEGGNSDARTDVFALGTVLYYLATGRLPFTGKNPHQILKRIADGEYPDPLRVAPRIGQQFASIVKKALERDPANRQASAEALSAELGAFVLEVGIEDAHGMVARYLAAPDVEGSALVPKIVAANITLGRAARDAGRVQEASDRFGRVLALDEGNAEVLALLERMQLEARTPSRIALTAGVVAALMVAAGAWAFFGPNSGGGWATEADAGALDASLGNLGGSDDAGSTEVRLDASERDATSPDASAPLPDAETAVDSGRDPGRRDPPRLTGTRRVVFEPDPAGVSISIDDGSALSISDLRDIELSLGTHRVRIVPNRDVNCCDEASFTIDVVPGDEPMHVRRVLASRDAAFIVRASGPTGARVFGRLFVGDGVARGTTGSTLDVPIRAENRRGSFTFEVRADGFRTYTGEITLAAGEVAELRVTMEPEPLEAP